MRKLKVYIAGKVSKNSSFGRIDWRQEFVAMLSERSGVELENLDPMSVKEDPENSYGIFAKDCQLINKSDFMIVYLSDDISVGGSQEILIARYLKKPVIGFAPYKGKFNLADREVHGKMVDNYKDPFVFSTCDIVCGNEEELLAAVQKIHSVQSTGLKIIDEALK